MLQAVGGYTNNQKDNTRLKVYVDKSFVWRKWKGKPEGNDQNKAGGRERNDLLLRTLSITKLYSDFPSLQHKKEALTISKIHAAY